MKILQWYSMRIGFCGAQGTGKSTLLNKLMLLPEFSDYKRSINPQRSLSLHCSNFNINSNTTYLSQISITACYAIDLINNSNYITDRTIIDTLAYVYASDNISVNNKHIIEDTFNSVIQLYDVIFYTPIEFEVEDDGVRSTDVVYRSMIDMYCKRFLDHHYPQFVTLTGSVESRLHTILTVINQLHIKE